MAASSCRRLCSTRVTRAPVASTASRAAASVTATTSLPLIAPETAYYDRINQLDLRIGKILKYGRTRANLSLDLYNLFNKSTVTGAGFGYTATTATNNWLAPSSVIAPRLAKVSVTFDF